MRYDAFRPNFFQNFEQPLFPRTMVQLARNFGNARFRQSAIFRFETVENKNKQTIFEVDFWFLKKWRLGGAMNF